MAICRTGSWTNCCRSRTRSAILPESRPKEFSGRFYTRWDDQKLYFAAVFNDSTPVANGKDRVFWTDDNIMFTLYPWTWHMGEPLNSGYYREHIGPTQGGKASIVAQRLRGRRPGHGGGRRNRRQAHGHGLDLRMVVSQGLPPSAGAGKGEGFPHRDERLRPDEDGQEDRGGVGHGSPG